MAQDVPPTAPDLGATQTAAEDAGGTIEPGPGPLGPEKGQLIDRYIVVDTIGAGGVGIVYRAFDPELERQVAIKVLRPASPSPSNNQERLLREGKAIAQLNHPNVVTVYEMGLWNGAVFVAMEYVAGQSLRGWVEARQRTVEEILNVFRQAAAGLAAAHVKGIVHRDFKPDNVLVGDDGRVRVADFGLARAVGEQDEVPDVADDYLDSPPGLKTTLTRTGVIVGTPVYMSPEQHVGGTVDERSDQWSFCAALYEALCRQRPHIGDTLRSLRESVVNRPPRPMPADRPVPGWLARVVLRGLATEPGERFTSMDALVSGLRTPRGRRNLVVAAAAAIVLATGGALAASSLRTPAPTCDGAPDVIAQAWNDDVRQRIRANLESSGLPSAGSAATRALEIGDDYRAAWIDMRRQSCLTTRRGDQSPQLLDLRTHCLDRKRDAMKSSAEVLATGAAQQIVGTAPDVMYGLPALSECGDPDALAAAVPPPSDPAKRQRVQNLQRDVDRAAALYEAGAYKEGRAVADQAVERARELQYAPLLASAEFTAARFVQQDQRPADADALFTRAAEAAAMARDDRLAARAWFQLASNMISDRQLEKEGQLMLAVARAAIARIEAPDLEVDLLALIANQKRLSGNADEARPLLEEALDKVRAAFGPDTPREARILGGLGIVARHQGKPDEAESFYSRALELTERLYGPDHPQVAFVLNNWGVLHLNNSRFEKSRPLLERCLAIRRNSLGKNHPYTTYPLMNLAVIERQVGSADKAMGHLQEALRVAELNYEPDHSQLAYINQELGVLARMVDEPERARRHHQRALEALSKRLGPDNPEVGYPLVGLGETHLLLDRPDLAIGFFERAASVRKPMAHRGLYAEALFGVARALRAAGRDKARALAHAREAHKLWQERAGAGIDENAAADAAEVGQWLREQEGR